MYDLSYAIEYYSKLKSKLTVDTSHNIIRTPHKIISAGTCSCLDVSFMIARDLSRHYKHLRIMYYRYIYDSSPSQIHIHSNVFLILPGRKFYIFDIAKEHINDIVGPLHSIRHVLWKTEGIWMPDHSRSSKKLIYFSVLKDFNSFLDNYKDMDYIPMRDYLEYVGDNVL